MSKSSAHTAPRTHRFLALLWPALALLACAALWTATLLHAASERRRAEEQAFKEADAYAEAYEQYVTRSVAQVDQISMQLKHSWEHTHDRSLIENMRRDGMFTDTEFVNVSVVGPDGTVRSSNRIQGRALNLAHDRLVPRRPLGGRRLPRRPRGRGRGPGSRARPRGDRLSRTGRADPCPRARDLAAGVLDG